MGFASALLLVAEFANRPFVRAALRNPYQPTSVLSFYLVSLNIYCMYVIRSLLNCLLLIYVTHTHIFFIQGVDYANPGDSLKEGHYINHMNKFWFGGYEEYDKLCQPFVPVIRDCGNKLLPDEPWNTSVDGKMSQIILCDQLSRNCFRGTDEAYAYDDTALDIAKFLTATCILGTSSTDKSNLVQGEFYPPYATFVVMAMMHSESLDDHEKSLEVLDWAAASASNSSLESWWTSQKAFELDHKKVIDRFGRYPHRNKKKGRKSTKEELAWLANEQELPGWAKSQK